MRHLLGSIDEECLTAVDPTRPKHHVKLAFIAQTLLMACCTAIVMFHVTRMAKAILRRIDTHG